MIANEDFSDSVFLKCFDELINITQKISNLEEDQNKQRIVYFANFVAFKNVIIKAKGIEPIKNVFNFFAHEHKNNIRNVIYEKPENTKWLKDDSKVNNIFNFEGKQINKLCKGLVIYFSNADKHQNKCLAVTEFLNFSIKHRSNNIKQNPTDASNNYSLIFLDALFRTMLSSCDGDEEMQELIGKNVSKIEKELIKVGYKKEASKSKGLDSFLDTNYIKDNKETIVNGVSEFFKFIGCNTDTSTLSSKFDTILSEKNINTFKNSITTLSSGVNDENFLEKGIENLHNVTGDKEVKELITTFSTAGKEFYKDYDLEHIGDKITSKVNTLDQNEISSTLNYFKNKFDQFKEPEAIVGQIEDCPKTEPVECIPAGFKSVGRSSATSNIKSIEE